MLIGFVSHFVVNFQIWNGQLRGIFGQDRNKVSISKRPTCETANIEYGQLRGISVVVKNYPVSFKSMSSHYHYKDELQKSSVI